MGNMPLPKLNLIDKIKNFKNKEHISSNDIIIAEEEKEKEEIFEDMEEIKGHIYSGVGIKKMKAYKCDLKIDELNKKREYFWKIKTNHNNKNWPTWNTIKRAVLFDEFRASLLLEEYKITPVNCCINHLKDSKGNEYKIPNYCINDPYKYEILENEKEKPKEEKITFKLRGTHKTKITCSNYESVEKVKQKVSKKYKVGIDKIRLFFYGKEMKNDLELWNYNVSQDCVVILMITKDN